MAAKKLKHYFQEHPIKVISEAPLSEIMCNKDATGRVAKWAINLAEHGIDYDKRTAIKSQVLADFLVDWTETEHIPPPPDTGLHWLMHFDGSNNVAEYEALAHGLKLAKAMGFKRILCYGDSDLVVQQTTGHWDAKDPNMAAYRFFVQQLAGYFDGCDFHHIPHTNNEAANISSLRQQIPPDVALEKLCKHPSCRVPAPSPSGCPKVRSRTSRLPA